MKLNKKYIKKEIKKIWNNDYRDILIPIISIAILIIGSLLLGFFKSFIIFIIINCVYFIPMYYKRKGKKKKNTKSKLNNTKKVKKVKKKRKLWKVILLVLLTLFIFIVMAIIGFFIYIVIKAPEFNEENLYVSEPSVIMDKNGNEVTKLGDEKRIIISYDEVPEVLIDAIVATEDSRFF